MAKYVIEIEPGAGLGDPLTVVMEGWPMELFIGYLAFKVTRIEAHDA